MAVNDEFFSMLIEDEPNVFTQNHKASSIARSNQKSISKLISSSLPLAYHEKTSEKLGGLAEYKAIKKIMKSAVYESVSINEFEETWGKMVKDYNLENNEWLKTLFVILLSLGSSICEGDFWGGMSTTQRSESMNSFFDGYVGPTTSLKQFVEQYDNALKSKIEKEHRADFASLNSSIPMITNCYFEKLFQEAYTNDIFKLFQDELRAMIYCNLISSKIDGSTFTCEITDIFRGKDGKLRKHVVYNVSYNEIAIDIKCSCQLFEFRGIICRHIIKVLIEKNVQEISSSCYILTRWRKDIKHRHTYIKNCYDDVETNEEKLRYNGLCSHFSEAAEIAVDSMAKYNFLMKYVDDGIKKLMDDSIWNKCHQATSAMAMEGNDSQPTIASSMDKLLTPVRVRTKGRPSSKRKESKIEQIVKKMRKKSSKLQEHEKSAMTNMYQKKKKSLIDVWLIWNKQLETI